MAKNCRKAIAEEGLNRAVREGLTDEVTFATETKGRRRCSVQENGFLGRGQTLSISMLDVVEKHRAKQYSWPRINAGDIIRSCAIVRRKEVRSQ